ncbi:MAG: hypothetical protein AB8U25_06905 [Rickettsiales endosymbiont of Dermacentor nuttalli]
MDLIVSKTIKLIQGSFLSMLWLVLGIVAIAIAGLISILLVVFRMPGIQSLFRHDFFYPALVVHVDLSILVWLLSIITMLWVAITNVKYSFISKHALIIAWAGTVCIAISPFFSGQGIMNNYVPILNNLIFVLGLALFICGVCLQLVIVLFSYNFTIKQNLILLVIYSIALICLFVMVSIILSYFALKSSVQYITLQYFYEMLFWSSGHILQFAFTQLLQLAWLIIVVDITACIPKYLIYPFIVNFVSVIPCIFIHIISTEDWQFKQFFTDHMIIFGGIGPTIMVIMLIKILYNHRDKIKNDYTFIILCMSVILFLSGGAIGLLIKGINVIIPAHYHGSIVSITLASMGLAYIILVPKNREYGFLKWHPYLQGTGQLIHIIGLAWSGGYGVLRKNPGVVAMKAKIAMSVMGIGGMLSIIGGMIFIITMGIVIYNKIRKRECLW